MSCVADNITYKMGSADLTHKGLCVCYPSSVCVSVYVWLALCTVSILQFVPKAQI